jgi:hypothetical protein
MDNSLKPIEHFVKQGLAQRFQQLFGYPLVYSNANDKKASAQKLMARGLKYPFAFATLTGESVAENTYAPHKLWRRGLVTGTNDDQVLAYRLNLIPVTTEYTLTFLCQSLAELMRFKKMWLLGSINNALKFSVLYGTVNFDIHVVPERRISIPSIEGGLTEAREYVAEVTLTISAYLSTDELATIQAVNEIEVETIVDSEALLADRLTQLQPDPFGPSDMGHNCYLLQEVGPPPADGSMTMIDISLPVNTYNLILFEDRTVGFKGFSAALDGKRFVLRVTQGEPGGHNITWDPATTHFGGDIPSLTITQEVGRYDYIGFTYRHSAGVCDLIAFSRNYA